MKVWRSQDRFANGRRTSTAAAAAKVPSHAKVVSMARYGDLADDTGTARQNCLFGADVAKGSSDLLFTEAWNRKLPALARRLCTV